MPVRLTLALVAMIASLSATAASAAPQLLGLFAEARMPLICEDGTCTVEVTAICLQEARDIPAWQTVYKPVEPNRILLAGTGPEGEPVSMPVGKIVTIEAERGSWAVTIRLPEAAVRKADITGATLAIDGRAVLAPPPQAGDPAPQTAQDIEIATAAFNRSHETVIGDTAFDAAAAHVMNDMINTLPHVTLDPDKPGGDLWRKTFGSDRRDRPGMRRAATFYDVCADPMIYVDPVILRRCLQLGHDDIVTDVNRDYWDANKPGM